MSVDRNTALFFCHSKREGVSFDVCATIGRQRFAVSAKDIKVSLSVAGHTVFDGDRVRALEASPFVERFLTELGASTIESLDASNYEGATQIVDLNEPVPADLHDRFTAVCDVGTLEHVFNFPTAIHSLMQMVREGGHLLLVTPTNNEAGHGFYQFSPELFFRVLGPTHGFEIEEMLILEPRRIRRRWYRVADPEMVGRRAEFRSRGVTYLYIRARRTGPIHPLSPHPQQSDYKSAWSSGQFDGAAAPLRSRGTGSSRLLLRRAIGLAQTTPLVRQLYWWSARRRLFRRFYYSRLRSHFAPMRLQPQPAKPMP